MLVISEFWFKNIMISDFGAKKLLNSRMSILTVSKFNEKNYSTLFLQLTVTDYRCLGLNFTDY